MKKPLRFVVLRGNVGDIARSDTVYACVVSLVADAKLGEESLRINTPTTPNIDAVATPTRPTNPNRYPRSSLVLFLFSPSHPQISIALFACDPRPRIESNNDCGSKKARVAAWITSSVTPGHHEKRSRMPKRAEGFSYPAASVTFLLAAVK